MTLHALFDSQVYPCTEHFGIFDLDETIFPHWDGLDSNLGVVIREVLAKILKENGHAVTEAEIEAITEESYARHGLPMWLAAEKWGISHAEAHRAYHITGLDRYVLPELDARMEERAEFYATMREQLREGVALGMRFGVLTHGCDTWGRVIPERIGVAEHMAIMRGIDNYDSRRKCTHECLYGDFLRDAGFFGHMANVFMVEDRAKNLIVPARMGMVPYLVGGEVPQDKAHGIVHHPDVTHVLAEQIRYRRQWLNILEAAQKTAVFIPRLVV